MQECMEESGKVLEEEAMQKMYEGTRQNVCKKSSKELAKKYAIKVAWS